ncbi:MAG: hypothetical protein J5498_01970 [Bacteroidales bacterium]|nr:hypothetical protein [Bacteroidales bacterium]MBR4409039.1 hypothetical protein [Bacteroidales bacterium]MBR5954971.1 hypothetical protein [Bacteroidales bacterium]
MITDKYPVAEEPSVCMECGDPILYGRVDRKFCCERCKNRWHNRQNATSYNIRRRVRSILGRNYRILENMVDSHVPEADTAELIARGFNPAYATSFRKVRRHFEYQCFDIKYSMSSFKIRDISRLK